jgi:NADH-quinone oxidoreductase subunit E
MSAETFHLPDSILARIDELVSHYPASPRSAVLMVLHEIQHLHGYLSEAAVRWTAERLGLAPIQVLEVVTFYPGFRQHAPGRLHFRVCRTLSCAMAGSYELMRKLCELKGIDMSKMHGHRNPVLVSDDGEISVEFAECLAACGFGPVCMVNDDTHLQLTADKAADLLEKYSQQPAAAHH